MSTSIEWTDETWNPLRGCRRISPGCLHCYAERQAARPILSGPGKPYEGLVQIGRQGPHWTGRTAGPDKLDLPLRWREPRKVFVCSMSDLFYEGHSDGAIMDVWRVMASCPQHTFQVLTKRPERAAAWLARWADTKEADLEPKMARGPEEIRKVHTCGRALLWAEMLEGWGAPPPGCAYPTYDWMSGPARWRTVLPNVWIGTSCEDQQRADERIPHLLQVPAAVRFVSYEPALGAVDFRPWLDPRSLYPAGHRCHVERHGGEHPPCINWLIVGGESGPGARPFDLAWARSAVAQCKAAGVACFVKQMGSYLARCRQEHMKARRIPKGAIDPAGGDPAEWPEDLRVREWPKVSR